MIFFLLLDQDSPHPDSMLNSFAFLEQCTTQLLHHKAVQSTHTEGIDEKVTSLRRSLRQMTFQCKDLNGEVRSRREECADIRAARENSQAELERVHIRLSAQKALKANVVQESEMMLQAAADGGQASQAGALVLAESLQLLCLETDTDAAIARARELQACAKFLEEMELRVAHHIREVNAIPQRLEKATAQKQAMIATASQLTEKISALQRRLAETTTATVAAQEKKAMSEARHLSVQNRTFELEDQRTTHLPEALKKAEARKEEAAARHAELVANKEALLREAVAIQEDTLRIAAEAEADEKAAMETKQSTLGSIITTTHLEEIEGRMAVATAECAEMEGAAVTLRHLLKGAILTAQAARDALTQKEEELKAQLEAEKSRQQRRMKSRLEKRAARLRNVHEKQRGRVMDEEGAHRDRLEYHSLKWMGRLGDLLMQEHTARQCLLETEAQSFSALSARREESTMRSTKRVRNSPNSPAMSDMSLFGDRPMGAPMATPFLPSAGHRSPPMPLAPTYVPRTPVAATPTPAAARHSQGLNPITPAARRILFGNNKAQARRPNVKGTKQSVVDLFEEDF